MIKIIITRTDVVPYKETKTFLLQKTPTTISDNSGYNGRTEIKFDEKYETREVDMTRSKETVLLTQEIDKEDEFDLKAVISAVNRIAADGWKPGLK